MQFTQWNKLPPEIQQSILQLLAEAEHSAGASLVGYSVACKSWRATFEAVIFRELRLHLSDLQQFVTICWGHRRRYISYIGIFAERIL